MEFEDLARQKGKCCISEKPLRDTQFINLVELPYKVKWEYPRSGNFLTGTDNIATAIVHDDCIEADTGRVVGEVKFAIEIKDNEIFYHLVKDLEYYSPDTWLSPQEIDEPFYESVPAGHSDCFCSRCDAHIEEDEFVLRIFNEENNSEYRYCEKCQSAMGITPPKTDNEPSTT